MAITQIPVALRETVWAKEGFRQALYTGVAGHFLNSGIMYRPKEYTGNSSLLGQEVRYRYTRALTSPGLGRGSTLTGNEEALNIGTMSMRFGTTRKGVRIFNDDTIEDLEAGFDTDEEAREALSDFMAAQMDFSIFNQAAGFTGTSATLAGVNYTTAADLLQVTGQNAIIAPSADRIIRAGNVANDQSLTASNRMTLQLVDYAIELMRNSNQQIAPLNSGFLGELWISYEQFTDLKIDTTSPIQWYINAQAMAAGGDMSALTGKGLYGTMVKPVGEYGGVQIFVNPRVAYGVNASNNATIPTVRRAVLFGKNALSYATPFGRGQADDKDVPFKYKIQLDDYEYVKGIEARSIMGIKKNSPDNGSDIGTVVISTYAAAHTS